MNSDLNIKYFIKGLTLFVKQMKSYNSVEIKKEYMEVLSSIFSSNYSNLVRASQLYSFEKGVHIDRADGGNILYVDMNYICLFLRKMAMTMDYMECMEMKDLINEAPEFTVEETSEMCNAIEEGYKISLSYKHEALKNCKVTNNEMAKLTKWDNATHDENSGKMERILTSSNSIAAKMHSTADKLFTSMDNDGESEPDASEELCACPAGDKYEMVNHPEHYNTYSMEVIDMMVKIWGPEATATWCEMTAFKYRMRMGTKPGDNSMDQELEKERWYLEKAKELRKVE